MRCHGPLLTLLVLFGACSSAPPPLTDGWWRGLGGDTALTAEFVRRVPAERCSVAGDPEPEWRPGDELQFGLELFASLDDPAPTRWLVSLTVLAPPAANEGRTDRETLLGREGDLTATAELKTPDGRIEHHHGELRTRQQRVRAVVTDLDGNVLYDAESFAWDGLQRLGLHEFLVLDDTTRAERGKPVGGSGTATDPFRHAAHDPWWLGIVFLRLFSTFQANAALADVLWEVADMPGWVDSVGFLFSPRYGVDYDQLQGVTRVAVPPLLQGHVDSAVALPFRVSIGASPVLLANLIVVPPQGALAITAGIVGMTGHRPSAPHKRFVLDLLGARRGPAAGQHPR